MENTKETIFMRAAMIALGTFIVYRLWKAARSLFWTAFGIGWAVYWTGGFPFS